MEITRGLNPRVPEAIGARRQPQWAYRERRRCAAGKAELLVSNEVFGWSVQTQDSADWSASRRRGPGAAYVPDDRRRLDGELSAFTLSSISRNSDLIRRASAPLQDLAVSRKRLTIQMPFSVPMVS